MQSDPAADPPLRVRFARLDLDLAWLAVFLTAALREVLRFEGEVARRGDGMIGAGEDAKHVQILTTLRRYPLDGLAKTALRLGRPKIAFRADPRRTAGPGASCAAAEPKPGSSLGVALFRFFALATVLAEILSDLEQTFHLAEGQVVDINASLHA